MKLETTAQVVVFFKFYEYAFLVLKSRIVKSKNLRTIFLSSPVISWITSKRLRSSLSLILTLSSLKSASAETPRASAIFFKASAGGILGNFYLKLQQNSANVCVLMIRAENSFEPLFKHKIRDFAY